MNNNIFDFGFLVAHQIGINEYTNLSRIDILLFNVHMPYYNITIGEAQNSEKCSTYINNCRTAELTATQLYDESPLKKIKILSFVINSNFSSIMPKSIENIKNMNIHQMIGNSVQINIGDYYTGAIKAIDIDLNQNFPSNMFTLSFGEKSVNILPNLNISFQVGKECVESKQSSNFSGTENFYLYMNRYDDQSLFWFIISQAEHDTFTLEYPYNFITINSLVNTDIEFVNYDCDIIEQKPIAVTRKSNFPDFYPDFKDIVQLKNFKLDKIGVQVLFIYKGKNDIFSNINYY